MSKPLSPAAQAVFYAFNSQFDWIEDGVPGPQFKAIAAALRAAAYQVVPNDELAAPTWTDREEVRTALLAIADELEAQP